MTPTAATIQKRRGRPTAKEPGSRVTVWVPTSYHDRVARLAARDGQSISSFVRQLVFLQLRRIPEPGGE